MSVQLLLMFAAFIGLSAIRAPIGLAMICSGLLYLLATGRDVALGAELILSSLMANYVLLAVPLFIFAAAVMNAGTISQRLLDFCLGLVGRFRGGLAYVNIVSSLIFSGMSGSAIADAAGVGRLVTDMMRDQGRYPAAFAAALTAASATIGPIIPPSIPMVLYALVSGTSVGYLFLGGILPGLFMGGALAVQVFVTARLRRFPVEEPVPLRELPRMTVRAFPALMMPVILLVGIYGGATTPTEAAAVAAAYALLLASLIYRALPLSGLLSALAESARSTGVVSLVIVGAFIFNYVIAIEQVPNQLGDWLATLDLPPPVFLLIVTLVFLAFGCLLDVTTMLLVLVPLVLPALDTMGVDRVHFGVTITVNMMIGLITPPYGILLFVMSGLTGIALRSIIKEIWPFIGVLIATLLLLVLVPDITLWLPRQFGYRG